MTVDSKMHTLIGHRAEISSAQFNWDCSLIATGSMDKTVKLWDTASGLRHASYLVYYHFMCIQESGF